MSAALVFGEYLAATVVALMYAGGQYSAFAEKRARREMTALLAARRGARCATGTASLPRYRSMPSSRATAFSSVAATSCLPTGSWTGVSRSSSASALTGESLPVRCAERGAGNERSTSVGDAFDLSVARRAADSTYAGIVRLVEQAEGHEAPMARPRGSLRDRLSRGDGGVRRGAWILTGDPIRAVAVLVVATLSAHPRGAEWRSSPACRGRRVKAS